MLNDTLLLSALGVSALVLGIRNFLKRKNEKTLNYPPGPKGWPIVRNLFDLSPDRPWETAAEWAKKYGKSIIRIFETQADF